MAGNDSIDEETEDRVREITQVAVDELGGLGAMTCHHQLELLPAIVQAGCILVLPEERDTSDQEIADRLGITRGAVQAVFASPFTDAMPRIRYASRNDAEYPAHAEPKWTALPATSRLDPAYLAGAAAKFAYSVVRRRAGLTPPERYGSATRGS